MNRFTNQAARVAHLLHVDAILSADPSRRKAASRSLFRLQTYLGELALLAFGSGAIRPDPELHDGPPDPLQLLARLQSPLKLATHAACFIAAACDSETPPEGRGPRTNVRIRQVREGPPALDVVCHYDAPHAPEHWSRENRLWDPANCTVIRRPTGLPRPNAHAVRLCLHDIDRCVLVWNSFHEETQGEAAENPGHQAVRVISEHLARAFAASHGAPEVFHARWRGAPIPCAKTNGTSKGTARQPNSRITRSAKNQPRVRSPAQFDHGSR